MALTLRAADTLAEAGPEWEALFDAGPGFQSRRAWFEALVEAALPAGARPLVWMVRDGARPLLLLPMLAGPGRRLTGLATFYTTLFQPLAVPGATEAELRAAGAVVGRACRAWPVATLDALDAGWHGLAPLLDGLRAGGMAPRRFEHFGNWHQPVDGWESYLAGRPGSLRETIRRKTRACDRDPGVGIELVQGGDALPRALAAYEEVYARSWKEPEPAPGFNAALLPRAAAAGVLRMGVMRAGGQAAAAQYWILAGGVATVLKLAHDDARRSLSPGTVLTAHMIRALIAEGARELDFGRGDDAYKQLWAGQRRQRVGMMLANPWRAGGIAALLRHDAGTMLQRTRYNATS